MRSHFPYLQRGTSLIEVLVAMIILAIGLLGLVQLQARLQVLQMESYQRAQALMLLHDMASRIALNRNNASLYASDAPISAPLGVGSNPCPTDTSTRERADISEWCAALQGAAEATTGGSSVGVMVGGRGCVESLGTGPGLGNEYYLVTVAWQGFAPISAPPASVACGLNSYDGTGSVCQGDLCRRVVTTLVQISKLN